MALTLLRFAARNVRRHARRSLLTVLSIAGGLGILIFLKGVADGYVAQRLEAGLGLSLGHLRVRGAAGAGIEDADAVLSLLLAEPAVLAAAPRIRFEAFAKGVSSSTGIALLGVDPEAEAAATALPRRIVEGSFLDAAPPGEPPPVVLGEALARQLDARAGERIALLVEGRDGALLAEAFRVSGIFRTGGGAFDATVAYVRRENARDLLLGPGATEVIARLRDPLEAPALAARLRERARLASLRVESWLDFAPELREAMEMLRVLERVRGLVLFLLVGLAIFNTVAMSVFERRREFGVLLAVGMRPWAIARLVALEVGILAAAGLLLGIGAGIGVTEGWLGRTGIDVSALGARLPGALEGSGLIFPLVRGGSLLLAAGWVAAVSLAVLAVPLARLLRLDPAEALRERA